MNKKIRILAILLVTLTLFTTGCGSSNKNSDGYYNSIKWDSTTNDVKMKLNENDIISDDNQESILQIVENFEGIDGTQAWIMYYFEDDKLCKIAITPSILNGNATLSDTDLHSKLSDIFIKKYGECSESNSSTQTWNTKNSIITLDTTNYIKYVPKE